MQCNKCGIDNSAENKFCINCGAKLKNQIWIDKSICSLCGVHNLPSNNYCISCGESLVNEKPSNDRRTLTQTNYHNKKNVAYKKNTIHQSQKSKRELTNKTLGMKPLLIGVSVIALTLLVVVVFDSSFKKDVDSQYPIETKSTNPLVEAEVFNIASKFVCSCGSCNEESLEICKCERAIEERQFIRAFLEQNQKPDDIVIAVANKYGWMKANFASSYNIDPSKVWNSSDKLISKEVIPENPLMTQSTSRSKPWNTVCPVKGEQVDPAVTTVEYNGKNYGFCCSGCDTEFMANPEKYSRRLNADGTILISG